MLTVDQLTIEGPHPMTWTAAPFGDSHMIQRDGVTVPLSEVIAVLNRRASGKTTLYPDTSPEDYIHAPSGIGPLAAQWNDKPHRLVYDLAQEVTRLTAEPNRRGEGVEVVLPTWEDCAIPRNALERFILDHEPTTSDLWRASLAAVIAEAVEQDRRGR